MNRRDFLKLLGIGAIAPKSIEGLFKEAPRSALQPNLRKQGTYYLGPKQTVYCDWTTGYMWTCGPGGWVRRVFT